MKHDDVEPAIPPQPVPASHREALLAWPGSRHLAETVALGVLFTVWFALIYGGADWLTGLHGRRVRIHLDAELAIPLVPAAASSEPPGTVRVRRKASPTSGVPTTL